MKTKQATLFTGLLIGAVGALSFINVNSSLQLSTWHGIQKRGAGAPAGSTGAPGEATCVQCHGGTAQSGVDINSLVIADGVTPVSNYIPGTTYNVVVSINTTTTKNGFQLVALNSTNSNVGTITKADGTTIVVSGSNNKKYLTHSTSGNLQKTWAFTWTAPASNVGEVTFYLATNTANGNGLSDGDIIRLSQHTIGSIAGVESPEKLTFTAGYNASKHAIDVSLGTLKTGEAFINLVDLNGKSVFTENLGKINSGESDRTIVLPSDLQAGMYVVNLSVDNNIAAKQIVVSK